MYDDNLASSPIAHVWHKYMIRCMYTQCNIASQLKLISIILFYFFLLNENSTFNPIIIIFAPVYTDVGTHERWKQINWANSKMIPRLH